MAIWLAFLHLLFFSPQGIPLNANGMVHAQGGSAISLLGGGNGYVQCEGPGSGGCTTAAKNHSTANLVVVLDCNYTGGPGFGLTASPSITFTALTTRVNTAGNEQCRLEYAYNAGGFGSSQTYSDTGASSYAALGVLAFSGANSTPLVAGSEKALLDTGCSSATPCPPGSVSLAVGNVEVTFFTIPFANTVVGILPNDTDFVIDGSISSGSNEGFTLAHLIAASTANRNPGWEPASGTLTATTAATSFAHQ